MFNPCVIYAPTAYILMGARPQPAPPTPLRWGPSTIDLVTALVALVAALVAALAPALGLGT